MQKKSWMNDGGQLLLEKDLQVTRKLANTITRERREREYLEELDRLRIECGIFGRQAQRMAYDRFPLPWMDRP